MRQFLFVLLLTMLTGFSPILMGDNSEEASSVQRGPASNNDPNFYRSSAGGAARISQQTPSSYRRRSRFSGGLNDVTTRPIAKGRWKRYRSLLTQSNSSKKLLPPPGGKSK